MTKNLITKNSSLQQDKALLKESWNYLTSVAFSDDNKILDKAVGVLDKVQEEISKKYKIGLLDDKGYDLTAEQIINKMK